MPLTSPEPAEPPCTRLHTWGAACKHELAGGQLYLVTFEILFQFLEGTLAASHAAHRAQEAKPNYGGKQFKGTAPLGVLQDLRNAAQMLKLEILEHVLKDDIFLSHFSVARTVETLPEQALLGFRSWCGLEIQLGSCSGRHGFGLG